MSKIVSWTGAVLALASIVTLPACGGEGDAETDVLVIKEVEQPAGPVTIEQLEARLGPDAVMLMDREGYDDTYAKLGNQQFQKANDLTRWAAIAAVAQGAACDRVADIGVSGQSTRERIAWFADCENGTRIIIEQAEAEDAERRFGQPG